MGGGDKKVDSTSIRDGGGAMGDAGKATRSAWKALKAKSDGMGDIFGDDMVGGLIGGAYAAVYQLSEESFTGAAEDYDGFAEGLNAVADNHDFTELEGLATSEQIEKAIEGLGGGA